MRKTLVAAVALAPLCLVMGQGPALATDTVSNGISTPIATATATNGAPDDISITGSVSLNGSETPVSAVTQNSANNITNTGTISITNAGATGTAGVDYGNAVLLQGGSTGAFTNAGTISNTENTYSPSDSVNKDGIVEAPFASGTGRYGVLVNGIGTGAISNAGTIEILGNNSFGLSIQAPVVGGISNSGSITLTGDSGTAVQSTAGGTVTGNVQFTGPVTATGQYSSAVNLAGAINGTLSVYSSITATGYSTTTRPTDEGVLGNIEGETNPTRTATPTDTEQSGAAMIVSGNVSGGILIGAPPVGTTTKTSSTADVDADGVPDVAEGSGAVNVFGSAPALQIGASGTVTTIGNVGNAPSTTDTEPVPDPATANNFGLIVRGSINSFGTFDGVTSTALQIGAPDGTSTVNLTGGVRVVGSITAESFDADSTAVHIAAGSTVAQIRNEGFIESTVEQSTIVVPNITTTTGAVTPATAYGIVVDAGATLSTITNYGFLTAAATGDNASATAILDKSTGMVANGAGGMTSTGPVTLTNEGVLTSSLTPGVAGDATSGRTIAADFSANQTGVNLIQMANPNPIPIDVETTTSASGTTTTTAAPTGVVSGSTVDTNSVTTTSSTTTTTVTTTAAGITTTAVSTTPTLPSIVGDVLLGSGTNNVQLLAGGMIGALDLGSGANSSLTIDNTTGVAGDTTSFVGALTYEGTGLTLSVNNGVLFNTSPTTLNAKTLTVGSNGTLYFAIDPAHDAVTQITVSGSATLAGPTAAVAANGSTPAVAATPGARIGLDLLSPLATGQTYTLIQTTGTGTLTNGNTDASVLGAVPYLINAAATTNTATGTLSVTVSNKTPQQLGLNPGETAAFNPILTSLPTDPGIESALLGTFTKSTFLGVYDQLLPDYAGGVFQMASAASDAITRATSRTNDIENPSGTRGAWAQEFAFGIDRSRSDTPGYQGDGFGFVGGLEAGGAGLGAFGVTGAFAAGSIRDPHAPGGNSQSISEGEIGAYWQGQVGGFRADARVGGGYLNFSDRRELLETDATTGAITLDRSAKAGSQGWSGTGHIGAAYQFAIGGFYFRPEAKGDYFELYEGGMTEHGGASTNSAGVTTDGFDLAIAGRTGRQGSATASFVAGTTVGSGFVFRPELELGYRDVFTGTAGDTTAHFVSGGQNFTLAPAAITGGGPVARFGVKGDTDFYELDFQAGAEERNSFYEADVRLNIRILF